MLTVMLVFLPAMILFTLIYSLSSRTGPDKDTHKKFRKDF